MSVTTTLGKAGISTSGAETTYNTANAFTYAIDGVAYSKSAVTGGTTPTTDGNTGSAFDPLDPGTISCFVWAVDSGGTVKVYQGDVASLDSAGNVVQNPNWPSIPNGVAPFAYTVVKVGTGASAWTFGSSNWNASGVTVSSKDIVALPSMTQSS